MKIEETTTLPYFFRSSLCIKKNEITEMNIYFKHPSFSPNCPETPGEDTSKNKIPTYVVMYLDTTPSTCKTSFCSA